MEKIRSCEDVLMWFNTRNICGKAIADIQFSGDDPFLDKDSMKTLVANRIGTTQRIPLKVHERDIPDELCVTRGRAAYGCSVSLLFHDRSSVSISIDDGWAYLDEGAKFDRAEQQKHNIDEKLLFMPILNKTIAEIKMKCNGGDPMKGIHSISFHLTDGRILYLGSAGVYILEKEGEPMQITMGEKKQFIRDYKSLFDAD